MDEIQLVLMNSRASKLSQKIGKPFRHGDYNKDAEIVLDDNRVISICLDGGFMYLEGLANEEEDDVTLLQFATEGDLLSFLDGQAN